jgi:hypothetical protein
MKIPRQNSSSPYVVMERRNSQIGERLRLKDRILESINKAIKQVKFDFKLSSENFSKFPYFFNFILVMHGDQAQLFHTIVMFSSHFINVYRPMIALLPFITAYLLYTVECCISLYLCSCESKFNWAHLKEDEETKKMTPNSLHMPHVASH